MFLCPSSIFGAIRTGSYMTYILMTKGLKQSVCDQSFYNGPVSKFWAYAFVLSKAPELGKSRLFCVNYFNPDHDMPDIKLGFQFLLCIYHNCSPHLKLMSFFSLPPPL